MIYYCKPLCERGAEFPAWQNAFGKGYLGMLRIAQERDEQGLWSSVATFSPLPFVEPDETWPRQLWRASMVNEWEEFRFIEGVEPLRTCTVTRWLRQVWRLAQLNASEMAVVEAKMAECVPAIPR